MFPVEKAGREFRGPRQTNEPLIIIWANTDTEGKVIF